MAYFPKLGISKWEFPSWENIRNLYSPLIQRDNKKYIFGILFAIYIHT